jgi:hypothetical protein
MTVSDFVPTLQPMVESVSVNLRYVCFFILTSSVVVKTAKAGNNVASMLRPLVAVAVICGLIATLPFWFNLIRDTFWEIAASIRQEFAPDEFACGPALLQLLKPPEEGINWLDVSDSLMKAVQFALGWIVVSVGAMVQLPMMLIQFIMECLCYLFLPVALSLFALDVTRGLALRYLQQTLAILAWPIGFAVVDMVGYAILVGPISAGSALALAVGAATKFTPATLLLGCIVALWLILGSLATPIVMQALFCSGSPVSSAMGQAMQLGLGAMGLAKLSGGGKSSPVTAGAVAPAAVAAAPVAMPVLASWSALSGMVQRAALPAASGPGPLALTSSLPPPQPVPGTPPHLPPRGHTQPRKPPVTLDMARDPTGTLHAAQIMDQTRVPQAIPY